MSDVDLQPPTRERGTLGILLLAVPVVAIAIVGTAYVVMFWFGLAGRPADSGAVRLSYRGCAEAAPIVDRRLAAMGLDRLGGDPTPDGFDVVTRLIGDAHAAAFVPALLAAPGRFEVRGQPEGEVLLTEADVAESSPEMRFLDAPHARVLLRPEGQKRFDAWQLAHPDGHVEVRFDGVKVADWKNTPPLVSAELSVDKIDGSARERIDLAAALPIALGSGPLPCPVTLVGTRPEPAP